MKIGILGDTHGASQWTAFALDTFKERGIDTVIQVGDFGIAANSGGKYFLQNVENILREHDMKMYVVPGNHENWTMINDIVGDVRDQWFNLTERIFLAPRGLRWEWEGVSFVALGGAPSIDRDWRVIDQVSLRDPKDQHWFEEEMITPEDVQYVIDGGYADVMIAHDAPRNVPTIDARIAKTAGYWKPLDVHYAAEGRLRMDTAFRGVSPKLFFHGHYHFKVDELIYNPTGEKTRILGMDRDGFQNSLGALDLETLDFEHWDNLHTHKTGWRGYGDKE